MSREWIQIENPIIGTSHPMYTDILEYKDKRPELKVINSGGYPQNITKMDIRPFEASRYLQESEAKYDFLETIQITFSEISACTAREISKATTPLAESAITKVSKFAQPTCCGFSASVFAYFDCMHDNYDEANRITFNDFALTGSDPAKVKFKTSESILLVTRANTLQMNREEFIEGAKNFYVRISPYCNAVFDTGKHMRRIKASSGSMTCYPARSELQQGANLVTLYSTNINPCVTHHHFFAYVSGDYVVIADTWLGGKYGKRHPWIRIMNLGNFQDVLNSLGPSRNNDIIRLELLKTYFYAPFPKDTDSYIHEIQVYSINNVDDYTVSARGITFNDNLYTRMIRYAFPERRGMFGLSRSNSMNFNSAIGVTEREGEGEEEGEGKGEEKGEGEGKKGEEKGKGILEKFIKTTVLDYDNYEYSPELGLKETSTTPILPSEDSDKKTKRKKKRNNSKKTRKYRRNRITRKKRTLGKKKGENKNKKKNKKSRRKVI